jgi:hypothetical protein
MDAIFIQYAEFDCCLKKSLRIILLSILLWAYPCGYDKIITNTELTPSRENNNE